MPSYTFKTLTLNDYFLYTKTEVPLDKQGLVLLGGTFGSDLLSNGAGKSLLFSGIPFLLQGKLPTGKLAAAAQSKVNLSLSTILTDRKKVRYDVSLKKNNYEILKNNKIITPHRKPDTVKTLQALFPEESILNSTCFVSQFSPIYTAVIGGSPAVRAKVIEDFLDQSKIISLKQKLKTKEAEVSKALQKSIEYDATIKEIVKELATIKVHQDTVPLIKKNKAKLKLQLKDAREELEQRKSDIKDHKKYMKLKAKVDTFSITRKEAEEACKKLRKKIYKLTIKQLQITEAQEEIELYFDLGSPILFDIDLPYDILGTRTTFGFSKKEIVSKKKAKTLFTQFLAVSRDIKSNAAGIKKYSKVESKTKCPTCGTKLKKEMIQTILKGFRSELKALKNKKKSLEIKIGTIDAINAISSAFRNVPKDPFKKSSTADEVLSYYADPIEKDELKLDETEIYLQNLIAFESISKLKKKNWKTEEKKVTELKGKIISLSRKLELSTTRLAEEKYKLKRKKSLNADLEVVAGKRKKLSKNYKDDQTYLPLLLRAIGSRDMRSEIMMGFCEMLVDDWNIYAPDLFDKKVVFKVGTDKGYPSFLFSRGDKGPDYDIRFLSGGEKKRLIACMIPSIVTTAPSPTNILVVDELDANLDTMGVEAIMNFFPQVLESDLGKTSIFFISARQKLHHPDYSNWFIDRTGNNSTLRME
jgi:hypothetical protein